MHATSVWSKENLPPRTKGALQPGSLWRDVPNHRCTWSVAGMRRDVPNLACYCHHPLGAFPSPLLTIRFIIFVRENNQKGYHLPTLAESSSHSETQVSWYQPHVETALCGGLAQPLHKRALMQGTRFCAHGLLQALACEVISTGRWQVRQAGKCDFFKLLPHEVLEALTLAPMPVRVISRPPKTCTP